MTNGPPRLLFTLATGRAFITIGHDPPSELLAGQIDGPSPVGVDTH